MPLHKHIDPEKVRELHAQGLGIAEIAQRLDISPSTIYYHLAKLGLKADKAGRRRDPKSKAVRAARQKAAAIEARLDAALEDATLTVNNRWCDAIWATLPLAKKAQLLNKVADLNA